MEKAIILFIALNFCHFLADYTPLSTKEMLAAKRFGKPIFPIFAHGGVHAVLMIIPLWIFSPSFLFAALLASFQQITHTVIDTLKGRFAKWIPITADNTQKWYWMVMGFDQLSHQTIIALMIYILLKY
jgi:hypothetical protein